MAKKPLIGILMGSDSDLDEMKEAAGVLEEFGIPYEVRICSAHRCPELVAEYAEKAWAKGIQVLIAGAGGAAHLAGALASRTIIPVIGVPLESSPLKGLDALLSTAQMPGGVPVATMAIGKAGARNAALLALQILALYDEKLRSKLTDYRARLAASVEEKDRALRLSKVQGPKSKVSKRRIHRP